jgi:spore coat protein U-like protein
MRRIVNAVAAAIAMVAGSTAALADSGTVALKGKVDLVCTIAVTDLNQSLELVQGTSNKTVGTMVENCNSGTGYTVSLSSANGGALKSAGAGTAAIAYTVAYDGQSGSLGSAMQVTRSTAQFARNAALSVTVPANAQAIAGDYADTVTITIAAK